MARAGGSRADGARGPAGQAAAAATIRRRRNPASRQYRFNELVSTQGGLTPLLSRRARAISKR